MASFAKIQQRLKTFDLTGLFTQELLWNNFRDRDIDIQIDGKHYVLSPVAEQSGMAVYACLPATSADFPDYPTRRKIDTRVAKIVREHIVIYQDPAKQFQIWQWVKREAGKASACREQRFEVHQTGDALIQKLLQITFSLEDEPTIGETREKVKKAFDLEKVTKRFYDEFKKQHAAFLKFLKGIPDEHLQRWYASVMLNRLMFIYFIQKKGFLCSDLDYLKSKLAESKKRGKDEFYSSFLCPLFFEGFAKREGDRSGKHKQLLGNIPYLNGGLFLKHQIEQAHGKNIALPDLAFERLFAFFDQYQWHLDDRPTRDGNEINPDVLGYVFEKYINQKEVGAYYTKEDITGYIGQNTIIPAVFDAARKGCKVAFEGDHSIWSLLRDDPDRYFYSPVLHGNAKDLPKEIVAGIKDVSKRGDWNKTATEEFGLPTETWREVVARRQRYEQIRAKLAYGEVQSINDLITYNLDIQRFAEEVISSAEGSELVWAFYKAVEKLSVLDPTCGSGAFLFAALNILEKLYDTCLVRMQAFVDDLDRSGEKHSPKKFEHFRKILAEMNDKTLHPSPRYFILKSIILNNLYGVDIMEEATEICKLRLFLKLVAQVNAGSRIEPLPDIDFNIRSGNTLVGIANEGDLDRAFSGRLDFDNRVEDIKERAEIAEKSYDRFRAMQVNEGMDANEFSGAKAEVHSRLNELRGELDSYLAAEYSVNERDKKALLAWRKTHQPFHWFVEFYGLMKSGGFDVIIGNPPYVEISDLNGSYSLKRLELEHTGNLYSVCAERFTSLLAGKGRLGIIVPISSVSTPRMASLMRLVSNAYSPLFVSNFAVRPGKLFVGADMNLTIFISQRANENEQQVLSTAYTRWATDSRDYLFPLLAYEDSEFVREANCIPKFGDRLHAQIVDKLRAFPPLANYRTKSDGDTVFYHSGGRYFRKCIPEQLSNEYKELRVVEGLGRSIIALLSSSLYYFYWIAISDCYHVTRRDVDTMPFAVSLKDDPRINRLADEFVADLWANAEKRQRVRADGTTQTEVNFRVGKSKPIMDCIDKVLAHHYKLSDAELDFVQNYDIKFRVSEVSEVESE